MKQVIRLTESELKHLIRESINVIYHGKQKLKEEREISNGTMRPYDVASKILHFLQTEHPDVFNEFMNTHPDMKKAYEMDDENHPYWNSEDCTYDLNDDLWDKMNDVAPEGEYFGAHPGDGASYGFWKSEDLNEAVTRAIRKYLK